MEGVREWMAGKREEMLSLLSTMVSMETPSTDKDLLDGFAEWLADTVERLTGISARIIRLGELWKRSFMRGWERPFAEPLRHRMAEGHHREKAVQDGR